MVLREYLAENNIQTYQLERDGGTSCSPTRDLFAEGVKYAHTASAFKNFRKVVSNATYKPSSPAADSHEADGEDLDAQDSDGEDESNNDDFDEGTVEMDDVLIDEEEFAPDMSLADVVAGMRSIIQNISQ